MANASYLAFREGILNGEINLNAGVIKAVLVRGYTYSAAHKFLSDVTTAGGTLNGATAALSNKTFTSGVFDADDSSVTAAASTVNHVVVVYQASAPAGGADLAATAQRLCFYIDTGTNIPIAPAAGTVTVTWPNTTDRIYRVGTA